MRKFAFVVFDIDNSILDRFKLDMISAPSGLGWKLKLSKIEGDIVDTLTKVVQEKQSVSLTVNLVGQGYQKFRILSQWLQKYSTANSRLALEYDDGLLQRYVEGKVTELKKTEIDEYGNLSCAASFTPVSPFFMQNQSTILIKVSAKGKHYPLRYPYSYGKNEVRNDQIDNPYIADIPVTVKLTGPIYNPSIKLLDEEGETYCRVQFQETTLTDEQYLIINSATRKVHFFNGNEFEDYSAKTDPRYDTFLFAQSGLSTISVDLGLSGAELTGSWRQYEL